MTQMNLSVGQKQNCRHGEQDWGLPKEEGLGEGWIGRLGQGMEAIIYRMDKPLYSIVPVPHRTGAIFNIL